MAISWSQINTFQYCPRKYFLRYRMHQTETVSPRMQKGAIVHKALERYLNNNEEQALQELATLPTEDYEDAQIAYRLGKKLLAGVHPVSVELRFGVDDDWKFVDFESPEAFFRGIIDLISLEDDGIGIWDWKTGWGKPDPRQIQMYAAALVSNGKEVSRGGYYLLNSGALMDVDLDEADILTAKHIVINFAKELTARGDDEKEWPQNFSACGWCDFRAQCRGETKEKSYQRALLMRAEANSLMENARKATEEAGGRLPLGDGCEFLLEESKVLKPKNNDDKKALIQFLLEHGYEEFINIKTSTPVGVWGKADKALKDKARYQTSVNLKIIKKEG